MALVSDEQDFYNINSRNTLGGDKRLQMRNPLENQINNVTLNNCHDEMAFLNTVLHITPALNVAADDMLTFRREILVPAIHYSGKTQFNFGEIQKVIQEHD
ncbi:hypothetical protein E2C01_050055 [Portunus trituberculatus]|uniref:Uncharacterized protein n=1 Tax=Portunus trituberculatus TaxID=210409 RepID=A0A5B7GFH4_PORTR|nr:hypothetical protein [Portunus trituberculatus]